MPDSRRWRGKSRGFDRISKGDGDGDFEEEDVWGFVKEMDSSSCMNRKFKDYHSSNSSSSSSSSSASRRHLDTAPRMIRKASNSSANFEPEIARQTSAPLDIPGWSKIYGKNSQTGLWVEDRDGDRQDHSPGGREENEEEDDDGEMVPPHEWIAKKLARSQISSFSVCEGVGRTLKGRDLSKVRNAVLTKTGFLE